MFLIWFCQDIQARSWLIQQALCLYVLLQLYDLSKNSGFYLSFFSLSLARFVCWKEVMHLPNWYFLLFFIAKKPTSSRCERVSRHRKNWIKNLLIGSFYYCCWGSLNFSLLHYLIQYHKKDSILISLSKVYLKGSFWFLYKEISFSFCVLVGLEKIN